MAFREIIGHRRVVSLLARSIAAGSLPPSLIFAGPEHVGKRLAAQAVGQALNCTSPAGSGDTFDACGACPACRRIARGVHPDVQFLEPGPNGSIKVEPVREAIDATIYRPFEGRRRVTIIDDADTLLAGAQNALLKTLEEPPASSMFVLVTSHPDRLLGTVRSRCAVVRFARLNATDVAAVLERHYKLSSGDALAAAATSDGSVRHPDPEQTGALAEARRTVGRLLQNPRSRSDARAAVERGADLLKGGTGAAEREHLGVQLETLASMVRDLGLLASGADAGLLANVDLRDDLARMAASYDGERAVRIFAAVDRAQGALERNVSPKVIADWLVLQL